MFQTLRYTELVTTFISSEMNFYLLLNLIFTLLLALPGTDAAAKKSLPLPSSGSSNTNSRPASSQTNRSTSTISPVFSTSSRLASTETTTASSGSFTKVNFGCLPHFELFISIIFVSVHESSNVLKSHCQSYQVPDYYCTPYYYYGYHSRPCCPGGD